MGRGGLAYGFITRVVGDLTVEEGGFNDDSNCNRIAVSFDFVCAKIFFTAEAPRRGGE